MDSPKRSAAITGHSYFLAFIVLAAGIIAGGFFSYRNFSRTFRAGIERQVLGVAELKANELVAWRAERLADASLFFKNAPFSGLVRQFLESPKDPAARDRLRIWLSRFQAAFEYERVFLLDARGIERIAVPDMSEPAAADLMERAPEFLRADHVTFVDFHRDAPDGPVHLSILVPIVDDRADTRALGLLVLKIDPRKSLYPLITHWPMTSQTAEVLILRREGNGVLFLNELRFQKNSALNLRIPLGRKEMPAVKAALGQEGFVEGVDYNGVPVLAALRAVPGSPWFLVARMDTAEAFAPLRERAWVTILLIGSLLLGAGGGISFVWRHQRARFYRERYHAAEALRESEKKYRLLIETADESIVVAQDGLLKFVNSASLGLLGGYSEQELMDRPFSEFIHPDDRSMVVENYGRRIANEAAQPRYPFRVVTRDGIVKWVEINAALIEWQGKPATLNFLTDITERKQAEAALRESEERFRTLYENSTLGLYRTTPDGRIVLANPALVTMLGYSSFDDLSSRDLIADGFEPSYPRGQFVEMIKKEGEIRGLESAWKRRDGTTVFVRESARAIRGPEGQILYFDGTVEDVTGRKEAEEELAYEQSLLRALLDNATDQVYFKDVNSRFIRISKAQAERFGLRDPGQAVGKTDFDFFAEEHARPAFLDEQEIMKTGLPLVDQEEKETWSDGRAAWVSTTKVPLRDKQGQIIGTFGISRDITARKRAEERLNETDRFLRQAITSTIQVLGLTVEARDPYTAGHQQRTTILADAIAREMGLPPEKIEGLHMAGLVHDVGKISIPAEILSKPTKLTPGEYALVKTHAKKGYEILKDVEFPWPLAEIVYEHHERMDGSGYPRGLKGEEILMEARILCLSDTVEAMVSHRPYRLALGLKPALAEVEKNKGILYDADVVETCLKLFREKRFSFPA